MSTKKYHLENYRKYLLNRVTASTHITEYIENCLASEDEAIPFTFHKIMIHSWTGTDIELFETLSEYFSCSFVPTNYSSQGEIAMFYTSSLNLVMKVVRFDFMFPHLRNMYNIDILFNDKNSADLFENRVSIDNIVTGVVSCRLNENFELDLSNFCNDPEFEQRNIKFYKLNLLSHFKILMLRMGRDATSLNLSNNNLDQVPVDILNFFIRGELTAINLSNNNIPSIAELQRVSSKIEKLWVEGNPLCDEIDAVEYVKQISVKFPRLTELDGVRLNTHGVLFPFFKNFLITPDMWSKMLVEKFMTLYFAHYDSSPRKSIDQFYSSDAVLSISTDIPEDRCQIYLKASRNLFHYTVKKDKHINKKVHKGRNRIVGVLSQFPPTTHDPTTFSVDVLKSDKKQFIIIIDGVFKDSFGYIYHFRRTFIFKVNLKNSLAEYLIKHEMFTLTLPTQLQLENSLKDSGCFTNIYCLKNPEEEDTDALSVIFCHLTQLKRNEAELRLSIHSWDLRKAVDEFVQQLKLNMIAPDRFIEDEGSSDLNSVTSSLFDDEIEY